MRTLLITSIGIVALTSCVKNQENSSENKNTEIKLSAELESNVMSTTNREDFQQWEIDRHADPLTGAIPHGMRHAELAFAKKLPHRMERALSWQKRGPVNMGGRTRALVLDVQDENTMLAGGVTGGVWKTTDGGQSWVKTTDPAQMHSVTSLAQDTRPGHEDTWYCGTGEYYGVVSATSFSSQYSGDGIFKSTDGGDTWTKLTSTSSGTPQTLYTNGDMDFVWRIVTDHTDLTNDVVLAAVYNGVFRSTDGGQTWSEVLGLNSVTSGASANVDLIQVPSGAFYATMSSGSSHKGFWRSDDGINWVNISPTLPGTVGRIAMAYDPQDDNVIWYFGNTPGAGMDNHSVWKYRYLTGDGSGANGVWENKSNNLPNYVCTGFFTFDFGALNTQSSYDVCIAVHPTDSNMIFLGGTNIYRTDDQFNTPNSTDWIAGYRCNQADLSDYVYPNHHPDQHWMTFLPSDPDVMLSANDGGVYRTDSITADSVFWEPLNNGYITTQFYTVAIEQGDVTSDYLVGGMQDNGTWFTNTTEIDSPWVEVLRGDGSFCAIPEGRDFFINSWQQGKTVVQDIDNDGNVISFQRIDPTGGPNNYNFINPLELDPNDPDRLYFNGRIRLWRQDSLSYIPHTNDIYNTISQGWTQISSSYIGISGGYISAIETCKSSPNKVWYGTSVGKLFRLDSADANGVQVDIRGSNFPTSGYISSVAVNPFNEDEIMVTFSNYNIPSIFYTNDGGQTWTDVGGNLEENTDGTGAGPAVYWAYVYPDGNFYVGTSVGLFSTDNLDSTNTVWQMEGPSEIGNVVINMIEARTFDGRMVVGTHGNGVYEATATPVFMSNEDIDAGVEVNVYPNPAINSVVIESELNSGWIEVYSMSGSLVKKTTILSNRTELDVSKLTGGTYIYRIISGEESVSGRFVKQ